MLQRTSLLFENVFDFTLIDIERLDSVHSRD